MFCLLLLQPQEETAAAAAEAPSTSSSGYQRRMTTEQWRQQFEADGTVDLFLNDDFNAGAKLIVSVASLSCSYLWQCSRHKAQLQLDSLLMSAKKQGS
jgi:hypothetical protein